ncbi:hypothetical protein TNCV_3650881 [Trichonephila clavipes]|uniref:Uncharacterized protein n=1 Tax=Trichonephila clavipes TaxID=2585209 RepID=A0A8X6SFQ7_TRICX|nr:hypothetical protein TNCV_3650881 [Trichonephila clavipes]
MHPPFIPRQFSPVFWSGFFTEIQSTYLIGLESAEGYPLTVNDIPKRGKFPKNTPYHDVFMGAMPSSRRGNASPFSVGCNSNHSSNSPVVPRQTPGQERMSTS